MPREKKWFPGKRNIANIYTGQISRFIKKSYFCTNSVFKISKSWPYFILSYWTWLRYIIPSPCYSLQPCGDMSSSCDKKKLREAYGSQGHKGRTIHMYCSQITIYKSFIIEFFIIMSPINLQRKTSSKIYLKTLAAQVQL